MTTLSKGYALGNIPDKTVTEQEKILDRISQLVGPQGFVSTGLKWTTGTEVNWPKYDGFLARCKAKNLRWMPHFLTSVPGGGQYAIPTEDEWGSTIYACVKRLLDQGVTQYQIWNEPDSPTGNCGGKMTPQILVRILKEARIAGRDAVKSLGRDDLRLTCFALGGIDLDYLDKVYLADQQFLKGYNAFSFHLYMSQDPALPGGRIFQRRLQTVPLLRAWLDDKKWGNIHLKITEGGYSGSNDPKKPVNCVTEQQQAQWTQAVFNYFNAHPELKVNLYAPYNPIDAGTKQATGAQYDYEYWYQKLGPFRADGSKKAVADVFAAA